MMIFNGKFLLRPQCRCMVANFQFVKPEYTIWMMQIMLILLFLVGLTSQFQVSAFANSNLAFNGIVKSEQKFQDYVLKWHGKISTKFNTNENVSQNSFNSKLIQMNPSILVDNFNNGMQNLIDTTEIDENKRLKSITSVTKFSTTKKYFASIVDDKSPNVSIFSSQNYETIAEGSNFSIKLTAFPSPISPIKIKLRIISESDHIKRLIDSNSEEIELAADGSAQVEVGTDGSAEITVETKKDTIKRHGEIRISLDSVSDADYKVTTEPAATAVQVQIADHIVPVISISPVKDNQSIIEGESFKFRINSDLIPLYPIKIALKVNDDGEHLDQILPSETIEMHKVSLVEVTLLTKQISDVNHGKIEVSIDDSKTTTYSGSDSEDSVMVGIKDRVDPVISISSSQNNGIVTEGSDFSFKLSAKPAPFSPIKVKLSVISESGHIKQLIDSNSEEIALTADGSAQVEVGTEGSVEITVETKKDTIKQHGEIKVSLDDVTNANYEVTTKSDTTAIKVQIKDHIIPVISISPINDNQSIIEGESFTFRIESDLEPLFPIRVDLKVNDNGEHLDQILPSETIEMHNVSSVEVTLLTKYISEVNHGKIVVSVDDSQTTTYLSSDTEDSVMVGIKDRVDPVISISSSQNNGIVTEGSDFSFKLSAKPAPFSPIKVKLSVISESGHIKQLIDASSEEIVLAADGSAQIEIGTDGSAELTMKTKNDTFNKRHGEIKISLNSVSDADYEVTTKLAATAVQVQIKDLIAPVISISPDWNGQSIIEGESFTFSIESDLIPLFPIKVDLNVTDNGEHLNQILPSETIEMHKVSLVEVTLLTKQISDVNHGKIEVTIDDSKTTTYSSSDTEDSVMVGIKDRVDPVVSISSSHNNSIVTEGGNFSFELSADPIPFSPIKVNLSVISQLSHIKQLIDSNSEEIVLAADGLAQVEIGTDGSAEITVETKKDTIKQHGKIRISLNDVTNADYEVTSKLAVTAVQIQIKDQNVPVISISHVDDNQSTIEGESFTFRIKSDLNTILPIWVNLKVSDNGEHLDQILPSKTIIMHYVSSVQVTLLTKHMQNVQHGKIVVSIDDSKTTSYLSSDTEDSIVIGIKDHVEPVVSISSIKYNDTVTEGGIFLFKLSADPAPFLPINVNLRAVSPTNHIGRLIDSNSEEIVLAADGLAQVEIGTNGSAEITVETKKDTIKQHGEIKVSLDGDSHVNYEVARVTKDEFVKGDKKVLGVESGSTILVKIKDSIEPEVSISLTKKDEIVMEGGNFSFELSANPVPFSPINVKLSAISESGHIRQLIDASSEEIVLAADGLAQVEIGTSGSTIITVETKKDLLKRHGEIEISLVDVTNKNYIITSKSDETEVQVQIADHIVPNISISPVKDNQSIIEGESYTFSIESDLEPLFPIWVDLKVSDDEEHLDQILPSKTIEMHNVSSVEVTLLTKYIQNVNHGKIEVSIDDSKTITYSGSDSEDSVMVVIKDRVDPIISISSSQNNDIVTEGSNFSFKLTAIPSPISPIKVKLSVISESGHIRHLIDSNSEEIALTADGSAQVEVGTDGSAEITVETKKDTIKQHGEIKVSLDDVTNANYEVTTKSDTTAIKVQIKDHIIPVISISPINDNQSIIEGESFTFRIESDLEPLFPIRVDLKVNDNGEHLDQILPSETIEMHNVSSVEVTLLTKYISEVNHGKIVVSVDDSQTTTYLSSDTEDSVMVGIKDRVDPVISISSSQNNGIVTEGSDFSFKLSAKPAPFSPIKVKLSVISESGHIKQLIDASSEEIVLAADGSAQIEIGTDGSAELTMKTKNDTFNKRHGEIKISIDDVTNADYEVAMNTEDEFMQGDKDVLGTKSGNSVQVKIEDSLDPVISISSSQNNGIVTEGSNFSFNLSANPAPFSPINVELSVISRLGHIKQLIDSNSEEIGLAADGSAQVEVGTEGSVEITVVTIRDTIKRHGEIRISLDSVSDADYKVTTEPAATAVQVQIADHIVPVISISPVKDNQSIIEGESFKFRINSDLIPLYPIKIALKVNDDGEHLDQILPSETIEMHKVSLVEVTLLTKQISDVNHGKIEVSIDDSKTTTYSGSDSEDSVMVGIKDRVDPVISISSSQNNGIVTEGSDFSFKLSAKPAPFSPIKVKLSVISESGHIKQLIDSNSEEIALTADGSAQVEVGTEGSVEITVETKKDTIKQHGEIKVSLDDVTNANYEVTTKSDTTAIKVQIKDHIIPVISISPINDNQSIIEGESFTFRIESDLEPLFPIRVDLKVNDNGEHLDQILPSETIEMHNVSSVGVTLLTKYISEVNHGKIVVSVDDSQTTTYLSSDTEDSVMVGIKDRVDPVISISSSQNSGIVTEGSDFSFKLSAKPAPFSPIKVKLSVISESGHIKQLIDASSEEIVLAADGSAQIEIGTDGSAELTMKTKNDTFNKRHGEIKISLNSVSDADYEVTTKLAATAVQVQIKDLIAPVISISPDWNGQSIIEGESFTFSIESDLIPLFPIKVDLNVTDNGEHLNQILPSETIEMHKVSLVEVTLLTKQISDVNHGKIEVTIDDSKTTTYSSSDTEDSVMVGIKDRVDPVVSISSSHNNSIVTEGGNFSFELSADPIPFSPIKVNLSVISQLSHIKQLIDSNSEEIVLAADGLAQVEIGTDGSAEITVETKKDTIQRHGEIEISLNDDNNADYEITKDIEDDENVLSVKSQNTVEVKIKDSVEPEVSISLVQDDEIVIEGNNFSFKLTATPIPITPIKAKLSAVSKSGHIMRLIDSNSEEIVLATDKSTYVEIGTNGSAEITVVTFINKTKGRSGKANIQLSNESNTEYRISDDSTKNSIEITIDYKPRVYIGADLQIFLIFMIIISRILTNGLVNFNSLIQKLPDKLISLFGIVISLLAAIFK